MFGDVISNRKQWPTMSIIEAAPITQNNNSSSKESNWLLNLDAIESSTGKIFFKNYVTSEELNGSICSFTDNHVLYSKLRPYLNKVVIPDESGYGTTELLTLLPKPDLINQQYLATALMSDAFVAKISAAVAGTKMPRVSMSTFKKFQLPIPPINQIGRAHV